MMVARQVSSSVDLREQPHALMVENVERDHHGRACLRARIESWGPVLFLFQDYRACCAEQRPNPWTFERMRILFFVM